jgi:hypothetical protein
LTYVLQKEFIDTKDMQSMLRQMNGIIAFNVIYNKLFANVNTEIVKLEDPL